MTHKNLIGLTLLITYSALVASGILTHEMWRDELQAWMLARSSQSIPQLLSRTAYEGSPALWHLLLYGVSRIFRSPVAMQVTTWIFATLTATIIVFYSPFTWWHKI